MRRLFCSVLLLIVGVVVYASSPNLKVIRSEFHKAALDPDLIEPFHEYMSVLDSKEPVLKAYKAASEALLAQITWSPMEKYQQVKRFEELINEAVRNDPNNLEIRFLRFSVEYSIPRFLGISKNLDEDRDVIIRNLERIESLELDSYFTRFIICFLRETEMCDSEYLAKIESKLAKQ